MRRHDHLHPGLILIVAVGGAVGTAARYGLSTVVAPQGGWPVATLTANLVGAMLLGLLLEALVRAGEEIPRRRLIRLGLGTGVLGGFTTFSAFAVEVERLSAGGATATALCYFAVSLAGGLAACLGGVALAARHRRGLSSR